jgi:hypothetical protein
MNVSFSLVKNSPCQVLAICYNSIYINKCIFPKKQNTRYVR